MSTYFNKTWLLEHFILFKPSKGRKNLNFLLCRQVKFIQKYFRHFLNSKNIFFYLIKSVIVRQLKYLTFSQVILNKIFLLLKIKFKFSSIKRVRLLFMIFQCICFLSLKVKTIISFQTKHYFLINSKLLYTNNESSKRKSLVDNSRQSNIFVYQPATSSACVCIGLVITL